MNYGIIEQIGEAATFEQTAEEATELAQAALKIARIIRGENPTPVSYEKAYANFVEEIADVKLCLAVLEERLGLFPTEEIACEKIKRWNKRLKEKREGCEPV